MAAEEAADPAAAAEAAHTGREGEPATDCTHSSQHLDALLGAAQKLRETMAKDAPADVTGSNRVVSEPAAAPWPAEAAADAAAVEVRPAEAAAAAAAAALGVPARGSHKEEGLKEHTSAKSFSN